MIRLARTAIAFALVACGDGTGPGDLNGTVTFTFTGAGGGTFTVVGAAPQQQTELTLTANLTAGNQDVAMGQTVAMAIKSAGGENGDVVVVSIDRLAVGSDSIPADCGYRSTCTGVTFLLRYGVADQTDEWTCALTNGTVAITSVTSARVAGTFSGTGGCYNAALDDLDAFTITNGTFNVALSVALPSAPSP